ncbi:glycosyltransferase family 4 protein [uncultured Roseobacter sp.]|uniref:glycosyltransferase family 4 protein n=1 Tax=uncultured Roseobacter sp. TaxID=114847 RepID=UPI002632A7A6|nr:glycosyltransferase family 4 protein [uncultured Roseobacter sp.]
MIKGTGWITRLDHIPSHIDGTGLDHQVLDVPVIENRHVPPADVVVATWWETALWARTFTPDKGKQAYFMQDYGAAGQEIEKISETWALPFHFITLTQALSRMIRDCNAEAVINIVPNSVDTDLFHAKPRQQQDPPAVGLLYRDVHSKGMDIAFDAIRLARTILPDLKVRAYGFWKPENNLLTGPGAEFSFRPEDGRLAEVYSSCDAWLFPSRIEGFGLPILEAMACRTPVISTPVGAAPELVTPARGRLVPHEDAKAMAAAITEIATMDGSAWQQMSQACEDFALSYSWSDAADRFEAALIQAARAP